MEILGLRCKHCGHALHDDAHGCMNCNKPLTKIQEIIIREHLSARILLMNRSLREGKRSLVKDEILLRSITNTLALMEKLGVKLREETINHIFRNHESRIFS